jgi:hypothetical protein
MPLRGGAILAGVKNIRHERLHEPLDYGPYPSRRCAPPARSQRQDLFERKPMGMKKVRGSRGVPETGSIGGALGLSEIWPNDFKMTDAG